MKEPESKRMKDMFVLHNSGQAEARNVEIEFHNYNRIGDGSKRKVNSVLADRVPSTINAGQKSRILMMIAANTASPWEVIVKWDDDFKEGNVIKTTLNETYNDCRSNRN